MRQLLVVLAAGALAACETVPEWMQDPSGANEPSVSSSSPTPTVFEPAPTYTAPPDQQLLELERQIAATAQERGLGPALASVIDTAEGMVIRPGETYSTTTEIEAGLARPANAGPIYWQPDRVHVAASADMGVTSGRYVQVITGAEAIQGRYVAVWRRDSYGEWKLLTETRVPDPPRPRRRR